jgi:ABC-2 type transport system ATP-binding protein
MIKNTIVIYLDNRTSNIIYKQPLLLLNNNRNVTMKRRNTGFKRAKTIDTNDAFSIADNETNNNNKNSIITSGLTKAYRNFRAVDSLTITVNPGDVFGYLGPNGAGKTTTIRMLCGLLLPTSGNAKVAGFDILKDNLKIRSVIGLLPESSGFYNWMNAEEYLLHFAGLYKIEPLLARKRANDLLEKVGLAAKAFAPIGYYSRGMKQRLGLARALINNPKIIFLDEPTLGLDPKGQQDIQKILLDLNREREVTIFLSSHALSEVSSLCNRVAIVNHGRLVAQGTIDELRRLAMGGSSGDILEIRILNSQSARNDLPRLLSRLQYKTSTSTDNRLINISVPENSFESTNNIIEKFQKAGLQIYDIHREDMSLEDVFFKLTEITKENKNKKNADYVDKQQNYEPRYQTSRPHFQIKGGTEEEQQKQKQQKKIDSEPDGYA